MAPAHAAAAGTGYDVQMLMLPPGSDVTPNFDDMLLDHNGVIYFRSSRPDGTGHGIYRLIGGAVEPLLVSGAQVLVQQLSGITTLLTIDVVYPHFVDAAGRVYAYHQTFATPGGVSHLLRLETGGGWTLLDTQGPIQGLGNNNYLGDVLSDGRWLRTGYESVNGAWIRTTSRTDGVTSQQILRRPMIVSTCVNGTRSADQLLDLRSNAQGKSVIHHALSVETFNSSDCSGRRQSGEYTQALSVVGGAVHVEVGNTLLNPFQLNDAGQILHVTREPAAVPASDTFRLLKDNVVVHTLTAMDPDEYVESSFTHAQLLPDGSVLYSIPPGFVPQHLAGGLFLDGQLVIAGNDPLFAAPVTLQPSRQVNSRGDVVVLWRSMTNSASYGWVLLTKALGRWTNIAGGAWDEVTNWAGESMPGQGANALFNLANAYTVNTGDRQVGSVSVTDGEVTWAQGRLDIIGRLRVGALAGQGNTTVLVVDRVQVGEMALGVLPSTDPAARSLAIVGSTGALTVSGPLDIGQAAPAALMLFGGRVSTGEARFGVGAPGTFTTVGGYWSTGSLMVGQSHAADVVFSSGIAVQSNAARIGGGALSPLADPSQPASRVVVRDAVTSDDGADPDGMMPSSWSIQQDLELGSGHAGQLVIEDGGSVQVAGDVLVDGVASAGPTDSLITVGGIEADSQFAATLLVSQDMVLGNVDGAESELRISAGGIVDVGRTLSVGHQPGGYAGVTVTGSGSTLTAGQANGASCTIGFGGGGEVIVNEGGAFRCAAPLFIGLGDEDAYMTVVGAGSQVRAQRIELGAPAASDPTGAGTITLNGGRVAADQTLTIWENGTLEGAGTLEGTLVVHGTVNPGLPPIGAPTGALSQALSRAAAPRAAQPGTLTVTGTLDFRPASRVTINLVGHDRYDRLVATAGIQLDGALILAFSEGYAPRAGDVYQVVAAPSIGGAFGSVSVTGLAPGWQYVLNTAGGVTTLTSTNDGVATTTRTLQKTLLPLVRR